MPNKIKKIKTIFDGDIYLDSLITIILIAAHFYFIVRCAILESLMSLVNNQIPAKEQIPIFGTAKKI